MWDDNGQIYIIKNLKFHVFDNRLDHAAIKGRSCIKISEIDDKMYLLPLTSRNPKRNAIYPYFRIPHDSIKKCKIKRHEIVTFTDIVEQDIWNYPNPGEITEECYYQIIDKLLNMEMKWEYTIQMLEKIKDDLLEQHKYLSKKYSF